MRLLCIELDDRILFYGHHQLFGYQKGFFFFSPSYFVLMVSQLILCKKNWTVKVAFICLCLKVNVNVLMEELNQTFVK